MLFFHINFIFLRGKKKLFSHSGNYYRNSEKPLFWCHSGGAYWVVHRVCFSNVYLYSTLTTNSISNYNHDVNLFPFMAYWLPSFIASSIIFWRLLLVIWWCEFSSQSGHQIQQREGKLVCKNQVKNVIYLYWFCNILSTFPFSTRISILCQCPPCALARNISIFHFCLQYITRSFPLTCYIPIVDVLLHPKWTRMWFFYAGSC